MRMSIMANMAPSLQASHLRVLFLPVIVMAAILLMYFASAYSAGMVRRRSRDDPFCKGFTLDNMNELLEMVAVDRSVMITEANKAFVPMARNWLWYWRKHNVSNVVFLALDRETFQAMRAQDVAVVYAGAGFSNKATGWRSSSYNAIVREKFVFLHEVLKLGYDAFLVDVDVVCERNPVAKIRQTIGDCDFLGQTDSQGPLDGKDPEGRGTCFEGDGLDTWLNTGLVYFRATSGSLAFLSGCLKYFEEAGDELDDQALANRWLYMSRSRVYPNKDQSCLHKCYQYTLPDERGSLLRWKVLPPASFPNGWLFDKNIDSMRDSPELYCVHFNFVPSLGGKEKKIKRYGMWHADDLSAPMRVCPP